MAEKLEDLRVYQAALTFCRAVSAILRRPQCCRMRELVDQVAQANESITANISEGFEQPTDAGFANFLHHSKASLAEVKVRLRGAPFEGCVTSEELESLMAQGDRLSKSIAALIRYLDASGFKDRGRFRSREREAERREGARRR